jgi:Caspase domain
MAKGMALLAGLKSVDPTQYNNGWTGEDGCWGCELDVDNVNRILTAQGFQTTVLKTAQATHNNILQGLRSAASSLSKDDILVFYYSGHGGQQPDANSPTKDEMDGQDETLVAFDREIIDDELNEVWLSVMEDVRIVMISDSCNSGTNFKNVGTFIHSTPFIPVIDKSVEQQMKAQLIHYGGCRDGFSSSGYLGGGAFTTALCNAWANGAFQGNYSQLLEKAASLVSSGQIPQYNEYGPVSDEYRNSRPFQIGIETRVSMTLNLAGDNLKTVKEALTHKLGIVVLNAIEQSGNARPCSVTGSGSADSGGNWSVSGSITCTH